MATERELIARAIGDGLPAGIAAACSELVARAIDDDADALLIAGAALLVEPWTRAAPPISFRANMAGALPHPAELARFVQRYAPTSKIHNTLDNVVSIWQACPAAALCRQEVRHAVRTLHTHAQLVTGLKGPIARTVRQAAYASTLALLNPEDEA
ncbi:hypothetical protein [uncultured Luteimonas sp.]|uniref:hypothetical protein n=1 Tax=uncultured Luteimonas sp. TaxID=453144 RepID=UPI0026133085|nr:hypothetical protein [uncultured Luteimonas sp.]